MAYTLVTANRNYSSWSLRSWLLMKALGIAFEERLEPFSSDDNYSEFRAFSPSGRVPCLIDGEHLVWDSLAITLYLAERHEGVWPAQAPARSWAYSAIAEMHSGFVSLRSICTMNVGVRVRLEAMDAQLSRDVARIVELWTEGLERFGGPWLAGPDFTATDAFFAPVVYRFRTYGLNPGKLGKPWLERMLAHPAMMRWEEEALVETWREEAHEAELVAAGTVIADHRR